MLRLHTNKKYILPVLIGITVFLPAIPIIANNLSSNDTSAIDYPMPAGFTDQNFYNCVVGGFKSEYSNEEIPASGLTDKQLGKIKYLSCNGAGEEASQKIQNADGLEKMTALAHLNLNSNSLTSIDVSHNTALEELDLESNQLTSIDVSHNTALTNLDLDYNKLTSIDLPHNTVLKKLCLWGNKFTSIDVSHNTALKELWLSSNRLTSLDVSHNTALTWLSLYDNQLTSIDVSHNTALKVLDLSSNQLTSIDVSKNTALEELLLSSNRLTSIDVSKNTALEYFSVDDIFVKTWISRMEGSENEEYDLSSLKFLSSIIFGEEYSFNNETKILSLDNPRTISYISAKANSTRPFKLLLPYYLTFDTNGGVGDIANQYCNTAGDCTLSISSTKPERDGYFFLGWADSSDATTATYQPNSSITISENKTLFAIWAPIYTLSFNPNNGTGNVDAQTCHPDSTEGSCNITIPNTKPERDGYFFLGWADSSDATTATYQPNSSITISENKTLFAIWAPIHTLSFNPNNGTGTVEPQSCTATNESCNVTIPNDINLSRSGYTLLGFADSASATTATYTKGQNVSLSADKTIYAVWQKNSVTFTLTIDPNGGNGGIVAKQCTTTEDSCDVIIPSTILEREGYTFLGYADSSNAATAQYVSGDNINISSNKSIYAVWEVKSTPTPDPDPTPTGKIEWEQEQNHTKGNGKNIVLRIDYPMSEFNSLRIDNVLVPQEYYAVQSGSTIITINHEYIDTLDAGEHNIVAAFGDGNTVAQTTFTIAEGDTPTPDPDPTPTPTPTPAQEDNVKVPDTGMFSSENGNASAIFAITTFVILSAITAAAIHKKHASGHFKYDE